MANVNPNNDVTIQGRLGQDSVLRYTSDNKAVLNLSVAISNDWYDDEVKEWVKAAPTWMSVTLWGNAAERHSHELIKGTLVRVMGKLSTRKRAISQEVTIGSGKSSKMATAKFEVTETYVTAASVRVVQTKSSAANSQVAYQSAAMAEPEF